MLGPCLGSLQLGIKLSVLGPLTHAAGALLYTVQPHPQLGLQLDGPIARAVSPGSLQPPSQCALQPLMGQPPVGLHAGRAAPVACLTLWNALAVLCGPRHCCCPGRGCSWCMCKAAPQLALWLSRNAGTGGLQGSAACCSKAHLHDRAQSPAATLGASQMALAMTST